MPWQRVMSLSIRTLQLGGDSVQLPVSYPIGALIRSSPQSGGDATFQLWAGANSDMTHLLRGGGEVSHLPVQR